jgi:cytochrome c biogenesis protein
VVPADPGFLVASTSLCIARNTPKILADLKAVQGEHPRAEPAGLPPPARGAAGTAPSRGAAHRQALAAAAGRCSCSSAASGWMVAAKAGGANKLGYLAAHSAIVLVCLGGLLDGDLIVRAQMWWAARRRTRRRHDRRRAAQHRLPQQPHLPRQPAGGRRHAVVTAILNQSDGILLQELPFSIELKKFIVEHYSTGMPKLFASEIVIHDKQTGERFRRAWR